MNDKPRYCMIDDCESYQIGYAKSGPRYFWAFYRARVNYVYTNGGGDSPPGGGWQPVGGEGEAPSPTVTRL